MASAGSFAVERPGLVVDHDWGYGLYSLGELLVVGLGLAMIARYVPARMGGFMMGAYFVAVGISQYLGGVVANYASIPEDMTDPAADAADLHQPVQQTRLSSALAAPSSRSAVLPLMKRLSDAHHANNALPSAGAGMPTVAAEE